MALSNFLNFQKEGSRRQEGGSAFQSRGPKTYKGASTESSSGKRLVKGTQAFRAERCADGRGVGHAQQDI